MNCSLWTHRRSGSPAPCRVQASSPQGCAQPPTSVWQEGLGQPTPTPACEEPMPKHSADSKTLPKCPSPHRREPRILGGRSLSPPLCPLEDQHGPR